MPCRTCALDNKMILSRDVSGGSAEVIEVARCEAMRPIKKKPDGNDFKGCALQAENIPKPSLPVNAVDIFFMGI